MNKVILIGNVVKDFELQETASGVKFARFSIAVPRTYGDKEVDFLSLIVWRTNAENCAKYLHKGNKIGVVGTIQNRSYEVNGEKKYAIDINVESVEFLFAKKQAEEAPEGLTEIENRDDLPF